MDKQALLKLVVERVESDLSIAVKASQASYEAATHEENRAEDQYDTRGLEASYLAGAQAQRVQELEQILRGLKDFTLRSFSAKDKIQTGALVELEHDGKPSWIFFLPFGAGFSLKYENKMISVVTPASPLGQELAGRSAGDGFTLQARDAQKDYEIVRVL